MKNNWKKILNELSYRVSSGIPDLTNEQHLLKLWDILKEEKWPINARVELLKNLQELDFSNKQDLATYASKHKIRPTTKVNVGGKETTAGEELPDLEKKKDDKEKINKEKHQEKQEFLLNMVDGILASSTEGKGVGRFNMSREDLQKYKDYLDGKKPEIPNYDINDEEVNEVIGILKSTLGENYNKFIQRVKKKGDPPKSYSTGENGNKRYFEALKHYLTTGGVSTITGEFVPFSESQLDHVVSLDNGGVDGAENWEWMESRFNQFKGALSDDKVMKKIQKELSKSPDEEKLKTMNQELKKYTQVATIEYYDEIFKDGGTAGLSEDTLNDMSTDNIDYIIKAWNESNPEGGKFFVPRYGSKKDDTGKAIDRKSGRASGGRRANKSTLIQRLITSMRKKGLDVPTTAEERKVDQKFEVIAKEIEKRKGDITNLKQKIQLNK